MTTKTSNLYRIEIIEREPEGWNSSPVIATAHYTDEASADRAADKLASEIKANGNTYDGRPVARLDVDKLIKGDWEDDDCDFVSHAVIGIQ